MEMVAFFAATALLLAGLGIYRTISYVVNEQRREIAVRLALELKEAISSRWSCAGNSG
jgi:ABC-type antimicrobial peptide transport system permease subunit